MLRSGSQRRVSPQHQGEEMKILNISFSRVKIKRFCLCAISGLKDNLKKNIFLDRPIIIVLHYLNK